MIRTLLAAAAGAAAREGYVRVRRWMVYPIEWECPYGCKFTFRTDEDQAFADTVEIHLAVFHPELVVA